MADEPRTREERLEATSLLIYEIACLWWTADDVVSSKLRFDDGITIRIEPIDWPR